MVTSHEDDVVVTRSFCITYEIEASWTWERVHREVPRHGLMGASGQPQGREMLAIVGVFVPGWDIEGALSGPCSPAAVRVRSGLA